MGKLVHYEVGYMVLCAYSTPWTFEGMFGCNLAIAEMFVCDIYIFSRCVWKVEFDVSPSYDYEQTDADFS